MPESILKTTVMQNPPKSVIIVLQVHQPAKITFMIASSKAKKLWIIQKENVQSLTLEPMDSVNKINLIQSFFDTVFENHRKSLIFHC